MIKHLLHGFFTPALFWLMWLVLDRLSNTLFSISGVLDVVIVLPLLVAAGLVSWGVGDYLSGRAAEWLRRAQP